MCKGYCGTVVRGKEYSDVKTPTIFMALCGPCGTKRFDAEWPTLSHAEQRAFLAAVHERQRKYAEISEEEKQRRIEERIEEWEKEMTEHARGKDHIKVITVSGVPYQGEAAASARARMQRELSDLASNKPEGWRAKFEELWEAQEKMKLEKREESEKKDEMNRE